MILWLRYSHQGGTGFGTLEGGSVQVHSGEMFGAAQATDASLALAEVQLLPPCVPSKMPALWNNFHERAAKEGQAIPTHPLYFLKGNNSFCAHGAVIRKPAGFDGKVVFEAELGIVIGRTCRAVSTADAPDYVFGYTCVNDVTAADLLRADASFVHWVRSKSFDSFCPFGPVIATGIAPAGLTVKAVLNGQERQNYPLSDMIFSPAQLVSLISHDMTLLPGDVIACGTSVGAGSMKPGSSIRVEIAGIGVLENRYEA
jgi:2-keto-4-pentenoate hydratase/2-oxohepta-3-ene-1,7-dioic acid hydratase in catechol pathway